MSRPLCIDLCCGLGGWARGFLAAGYDVVGFDVERLPYPGQLVLQDVRTIDGRRLASARVIVASPPCEEFSRHDQPWTRRRNPPPPDLSIAEACFRIAQESGVPLVLENVRGAQKWLGRAVARVGSCYLWGAGVPAIVPHVGWSNGKRNLPSRDPRVRAIVPRPLADHIARCYQ